MKTTNKMTVILLMLNHFNLFSKPYLYKRKLFFAFDDALFTDGPAKEASWIIHIKILSVGVGYKIHGSHIEFISLIYVFFIYKNIDDISYKHIVRA